MRQKAHKIVYQGSRTEKSSLLEGALIAVSSDTTASTISVIDEGMCTPSNAKYKFHCAFPRQERRTDLIVSSTGSSEGIVGYSCIFC